MVAPGPSPMTATTLLVNWDAVGAIGEWFGAVATAAATGVALWFGYRGDRIRLKVTATVDLVIFSGAAPVAVVRLAAANNGPRPATLTHAGAELAPGGGRVIIPPDHERDLPRRLDQGDHAVTEVHVLVSDAMQVTAERGTSVVLRGFFTDATGRRHWAKRRILAKMLHKDGGHSRTPQP